MSPINGNNGMTDTANLDREFLRGVQKTDGDGVVHFETLFPGHYAGRATHVHVMTHLNATAQANNTIWDLTATYAGQLFFDQDLIAQVEKTAPYNTNRQPSTANRGDNILLQMTPTADPFLEYVMLGDKLSDGVMAWYTLGVDPNFNRPIMAVAAKYKEGGKVITNPGNPFGALFPGGFPTRYPVAGAGGPQPTIKPGSRATTTAAP
jgi:hypothetical protein